MGRLSSEEEEGEERKLLTEGNQASQDGNTRPGRVLLKITQNLKQQPHENSSGSSGPSKRSQPRSTFPANNSTRGNWKRDRLSGEPRIPHLPEADLR